MSKEIKLFLCFMLLFYSCKENKRIETRNKLEYTSVFDTLTAMNYLFDIKKIDLDLSGFRGVMDDIRFCSVDKNNNIFVLDKSSRIFKFDSNGKYLNDYFKIGRGPGEYLGFARFVLDDYNNIYIDNWRMHEIKKYNSKFVFQGNFKKNMAVPVTDMKIKNNKLYCFYPFALENSITIYDINNFSLIKKIGRVDELQKKYFTRLSCGSLQFEGPTIYYILPNYYQIFKNLQGAETKLLDKTASHFKQVSKPVKNPFRDLNNQSSSYRLLKENNYFFLITSPAKNTFKYIKNRWFPTDIINENGKIIKEAIFFYNLGSAPEKYANKKYISWGNDTEDYNGNIETKPYVLLLNYKY